MNKAPKKIVLADAVREVGINPIFQFATDERWPFRDIAELEGVCLIN